MSKDFREKFNLEMQSKTSPEMREYCKRPGKSDEDGIIYMTEQSHKGSTMINNIIKKYHKVGVIDHVSRIEAQYGDLTQTDFQNMLNQTKNAQRMFDELPSNIRKRFSNSAGEFLGFMENPNNRDEAIQLGLISKEWTPETDGLGEHVKLGENVNEDSKNTPTK